MPRLGEPGASWPGGGVCVADFQNLVMFAFRRCYFSVCGNKSDLTRVSRDGEQGRGENLPVMVTGPYCRT